MGRIAINCADCGVQRDIPNCCKHTVTRCEICQKEFNRKRARERYRKSKGLSINYDPPPKISLPIEPKKKKKEKSKGQWVYLRDLSEYEIKDILRRHGRLSLRF